MRKGGGKAKGASFERFVCKKLSLWLSDGEREDVLWRSAMSGGRSTVAKNRHESLLGAQAGDITSTHVMGHALTDRFFVEVKTYKDLCMSGLLTDSGELAKFWRTAVKEAKDYKKIPLLISKQNYLPVTIGTNTCGVHLLKLRYKTALSAPKVDLHMLLLDEFVMTPCTDTRLLNYDYGAALSSFRSHQCGATKRQIEFHFQFDDWVEWWEQNLGPAWQRKRGNRKGQFVMARNNDIGPYAVWNVQCITADENIRQKAVNGTAAKGTKVNTNKLSETQVIDIFYDDRTYREIGNDYGVDPTHVYCIKKKLCWKHILGPLCEPLTKNKSVG